MNSTVSLMWGVKPVSLPSSEEIEASREYEIEVKWEDIPSLSDYFPMSRKAVWNVPGPYETCIVSLQLMDQSGNVVASDTITTQKSSDVHKFRISTPQQIDENTAFSWKAVITNEEHVMGIYLSDNDVAPLSV
jgi:hypothetical protein